eukprot:m.95896 g.95896  ORF g.95896 m.95896 type:complete len:390 (+) comp26853_c0_seq1:144-1313(+)
MLDEDLLFVFADLISRIEFLGVKVEGLYRIAGVKTQINALEKGLIETKSRLKRAQLIAQVTSVHTLTATLKSVLRKLRPPLLTDEYYTDFVSASKQPESKRDAAYATILAKLPKENLELIRKLRVHLHKVVAEAETNKMPLANVALMFAPNWMRSPKGAIGDITDQTPQTRTTETILSAPSGTDIYNVLYPSKGGGNKSGGNKGGGNSTGNSAVTSAASSPLKQSSQDILDRRATYTDDNVRPSADDVFDVFDVDGDDHINEEEFFDCARTLGNIISASELNQIFNSSAITRTKTMSKPTFLKALEKVKKISASHGRSNKDILEPFQFFDKGDTGKLTKDELVYLCRQCGGADALTHEEVDKFVGDLGVDASGFDYKSKMINTVVPLLN